RRRHRDLKQVSGLDDDVGHALSKAAPQHLRVTAITSPVLRPARRKRTSAYRPIALATGDRAPYRCVPAAGTARTRG
ncbi:MAG TPA: hypothetical protein VFX49_16510, partial [Chloroflexota bacterium]|nr:hypothetical protein [Chloroflexota bacterium]